MKKLFSLLGIAFALNLGTLALKPTIQCAKAEEPVSVEVSEEPTSEITTSSYNEDEPVINVDEEISKVSQTAADVIEVIKTIFNQKIVIGGISVSLGALVIWVLGRVLTNVFKVRKDKYEKALDKLTTQLGITKEQLNEYIEQGKQVEEIIKLLIQNLKNEKVKVQCLELLKEKSQPVVEQTKEQVEETLDKGVEQVNEGANKIRELLDRK